MTISGIDSETSGAPARQMQSSELGVLPELGLRNYSYSSSHLERCCRFLHPTRAVRGLQGW
eukprot:5233646-Pyramimonas_sp.AAC.1